MSITERFLRYTRFDTQSDENSDTCPSTEGQMVFARFLRDELTDIGLQDVELDEYGYLYATLPASPGMEAVPTIGFIAHLDTSPDCCGTGVHPRIIRNYHGDDIVLDAEAGIVTSTMQFPELNRHFGEDLIVTDGHTLLGADDKAGIAAIVEAMVYMMAHPEVQHGRIRVGFNPDEEIGRGAHRFDIERFGAAWAYTIDGSEVGELEFENFNAAAADVVFRGVSVHPGYAKGKLQNSMLTATAFINAMPADERPETTEGYEGFYHLVYMKGGVEETTLHYIIRDHDRKRFEARKQFVADLAAEYGGTATISDTYYNMREVVEPQMHIIDIARQAMQQTGVECRIQAIRGGTDGAQLSFRGLPCPNIFAGGVNFHGPHEFLPIPSLEKAMKVIVAIANGVVQCTMHNA